MVMELDLDQLGENASVIWRTVMGTDNRARRWIEAKSGTQTLYSETDLDLETEGSVFDETLDSQLDADEQAGILPKRQF